MKISINGKPMDIVLEDEKNVGEVLSGIEQWLGSSGSRLSGLVIDGAETPAESIPEAMNRSVEGISVIDIRVSAWNQLALEALAALKDYIDIFTAAPFDKRDEIYKDWEKSPAKEFLFAEMRDVHDTACLCFAGSGTITLNDLASLVIERYNEILETGPAILRLENEVADAASRMEEFPLDIQTGKDARALETLRLFTRLGDKLMRLLQIQMRAGIIPSEFLTGTSGNFLKDFAAVLGELFSANQNKDTVLAGDLTEYELAPGLRKLYTLVKECIPSKEADR